ETSAPSSANRCAIARPMPWLPPVIAATFPASLLPISPPGTSHCQIRVQANSCTKAALWRKTRLQCAAVKVSRDSGVQERRNGLKVCRLTGDTSVGPDVCLWRLLILSRADHLAAINVDWLATHFQV